jgi:hypothetical protein
MNGEQGNQEQLHQTILCTMKCVWWGEMFRKEVVQCWPLLNFSMVLGILRPSKPLKVCTLFCPKKKNS